MDFYTCPVGGHNFHGRVERKIKHVKESIEKTLFLDKLSLLQWETLSAEVANAINDLPIAIGSRVVDLENLDLLTPNRLRLGRNNERSPVGPLLTTGKPDVFIELNEQIFKTWFETWLISHVPQLVTQPKWFVNSKLHISPGDIVLFLKKDGRISGEYAYGMIHEVKESGDKIVRTVQVKFKNHNEEHFRYTKRSLRDLVIVHSIDKIDFIAEMGASNCKHVVKLFVNCWGSVR